MIICFIFNRNHLAQILKRFFFYHLYMHKQNKYQKLENKKQNKITQIPLFSKYFTLKHSAENQVIFNL